MNPGVSSFTEFLTSYAPDLLPGRRAVPGAAAGDEIPHATTIVTVSCQGGVVMAGDRRSTMGNMIAQRDIEKVFRTDEYSCMGIAGTASLGIEVARLFAVELEHYEKNEGRTLSVEGKANRLATMVRNNLTAAMQGFVFVPLLAAYDEITDTGRIFGYDVGGGPYEHKGFYSIGSGSIFARGSLKKLYREDAAPDDAVLTCLQALYDAADDDSATGGPDVTRRIWPVVAVITADGFRRLPDDEVAGYVQTLLDARMTAPDGPVAPLR
ncbi:proteasome subunit beta [Rhizohabitans arisaemae]|uniref:proteasome subunit beta n=1 Tax=Rhizohabitans arisaemae TaxID=2720610 RepID=UPI0024B113B5|nr:proteasome subunit beta [Rhizohabitans arisaemae]